MNSALSPIYWGSLGALFLQTVVLPIFGSPPPGTPVASYYLALLLVGLLTVRYYCAILGKLYAKSESSIFLLPPFTRKLIFYLLCSLVLLCLVAVGVLTNIGLTIGIAICIFMCTVSSVCWLSSKIASDGRVRQQNPELRLAFVAFDLLLAAACTAVLLSRANDDAGTQVIALVATLCLGLYLFFHECKRLYARTLVSQITELRERLNNAPMRRRANAPHGGTDTE